MTRRSKEKLLMFLGGVAVGVGGYYIYQHFFTPSTQDLVLQARKDGAIQACHAIGEKFPEIVETLGRNGINAFCDELVIHPKSHEIFDLLKEGDYILDPYKNFMNRDDVQDILDFGKRLVGTFAIDDDGHALYVTTMKGVCKL